MNKRISNLGFSDNLSPGWGGTSLFWFMDGSDPNYTQHSYASKDVTDGQWHHVVGVLNREEQTIRTYVDGQDTSNPVRSVPNLGSIDTARPLQIGNVNDGGFDGMIDDLQIYNRVLSKEQILVLFNKENNKLMKTETKTGESYKSCLVPNDGAQDGAVMCTESVLIE